MTIQYEASAVTWNRDTNTLFVIGDGGRYVQQVGLTGAVIDSMALPLASGASRAGVEFDDPEGLTWLGGSTFVMTEERKRNVVRFDYAPGTTLDRANTSTVTLGTTVGNTGLEGVTYDAPSNSYILVNQAAGSGAAQNIFQTSITFAGTGGSASNGSSSTVNATSLFPPANIGFTDLNDVYALSNVASLAGSASTNLLVLTNAGGLNEVTRAGVVLSQLTLPSGTTQIEGITMDDRATSTWSPTTATAATASSRRRCSSSRRFPNRAPTPCCWPDWPPWAQRRAVAQLARGKPAPGRRPETASVMAMPARP